MTHDTREAALEAVVQAARTALESGIGDDRHEEYVMLYKALAALDAIPPADSVEDCEPTPDAIEAGKWALIAWDEGCDSFADGARKIWRAMTLVAKPPSADGGWRPIETAPKDGTPIVCWANGWEPLFLCWKTNRRIVEARKLDPAQVSDMTDSYFGDPNEMDDYDLAKPGNGPTHFMPLPPPPVPKSADE
jgi:hypothetical protein